MLICGRYLVSIRFVVALHTLCMQKSVAATKHHCQLQLLSEDGPAHSESMRGLHDEAVYNYRVDAPDILPCPLKINSGIFHNISQ